MDKSANKFTHREIVNKEVKGHLKRPRIKEKPANISFDGKHFMVRFPKNIAKLLGFKKPEKKEEKRRKYNIGKIIFTVVVAPKSKPLTESKLSLKFERGK